MHDFPFPLNAIELALPILSVGIAFAGFVFFSYIYVKKRQDLFLAIAIVCGLTFLYTGAEASILLLGGVCREVALTRELHRIQQIAVAYFCFALPYMIIHVLTLSKSLRTHTKGVAFLGLGFALFVTIFAYTLPDLFISQFYPMKSFHLYQGNFGRGQQGPLYLVRDIALGVIVLYSAVVVVVSYAHTKERKSIPFIAGLLVAMYTGLNDIIFINTGTRIDPIPLSFEFSRFTFGITFFNFVALASLTGRFLAKALTAEIAYSALSVSEARFREFVRQSPDGIVIINRQGVILTWNAVQEAITGIPRTEAEHGLLWEIIAPLLDNRSARFAGSFERDLKALFSQRREKAIAQKVEINARDGEEKVLHLSMFPLESDGETFFACVMRDITFQTITDQKAQEYATHIEMTLLKREESIRKAQEIQRNLTPRELPLFDEFAISAYSMASEDLGGDFFTVRAIYDKIVIVLADCIGHGIEASMEATILKTITDRYIVDLAMGYPDVFLSKVSDDIAAYFPLGHYPTMFAAVIDTVSKEMYYANANNETPHRVNTGMVEKLPSPHGTHLGFTPKIPYEKAQITLEQGDLICFYSDALVNVKDERGDAVVFSRDDFDETAKRFGISLRNDKKALLQAIRKKRSFPLQDDLTLVLLTFTPVFSHSYRFHTLDEGQEFQHTLRDTLLRMNYADEDGNAFILAFEEMYTNAFVHGNKEDVEKTITVFLSVDCAKAVFTIEDMGEGFNPNDLPTPMDLALGGANDEGEGALDRILHGRGIWIARTFVSDVTYNTKGNVVTVTKKKTPEMTEFFRIMPPHLNPPKTFSEYSLIRWDDIESIRDVWREQNRFSLDIDFRGIPFLNSYEISKLLLLIHEGYTHGKKVNLYTDDGIVKSIFERLRISHIENVSVINYV